MQSHTQIINQYSIMLIIITEGKRNAMKTDHKNDEESVYSNVNWLKYYMHMQASLTSQQQQQPHKHSFVSNKSS